MHQIIGIWCNLQGVGDKEGEGGRQGEKVLARARERERRERESVCVCMGIRVCGS